jgi:hypothetical protein
VDAYLIDEIAKLECHCSQFADELSWLLEGPVPLVATIALGAGGLLAEVKKRRADRGGDQSQSPDTSGADRCIAQANLGFGE